MVDWYPTLISMVGGSVVSGTGTKKNRHRKDIGLTSQQCCSISNVCSFTGCLVLILNFIQVV